MNRGYILLFKKMVEWQWYSDLPCFRLFVHLLLKANHESKQWLNIDIKRGQLVSSLESLALQTGLSVQQIRTALGKLKSTGDITITSKTKFTIITIPNYSQYQTINTKSNKPTTNHQQTNNKPSTNNQQQLNEDNKINEVNEDNEVKDKKITKKVKSEIMEAFGVDSYTPEERASLKKDFPHVDFKEMINRLKDYCRSTETYYVDYKATIRNWARREKKPDNGNSFKPTGRVSNQQNVLDIPKEQRDKERVHGIGAKTTT